MCENILTAQEGSKMIWPSQMGPKCFNSLPGAWSHAYTCIIMMYANSCVYLIILYTLTCRHSIIDYVMPKYGLRMKQNCIYIKDTLQIFWKIYRGQQVAQWDMWPPQRDPNLKYFDLPNEFCPLPFLQAPEFHNNVPNCC